VLHLLARGHCNKRIARELEIGLGTVKTHVRGVMGKLEATTRTQAVIVAASQGLVGFEAGLSPA
jgi:DNA-binding NarL/FixJ family response regulator